MTLPTIHNVGTLYKDAPLCIMKKIEYCSINMTVSCRDLQKLGSECCLPSKSGEEIFQVEKCGEYANRRGHSCVIENKIEVLCLKKIKRNGGKKKLPTLSR